jgi:hypothetical protein
MKLMHFTQQCRYQLMWALANVFVLTATGAYGNSPADMDLSPVELVPEESIELVQEPSDPQPKFTLPVNPSSSITPILTTRPSFTDSWLSVPKGSLQVESGATYTDQINKTRSWVLPETLLKLGVGRHTDFRLLLPNYTDIRRNHEGVSVSHFGDMAVGLTHHVPLPGKVDLTLIPVLNIPTGANQASSNSLDPQFRLVAARSLTPRLTLASQFDARWNTRRNTDVKVLLNPTVIAYYAFTRKWSGFVEYGGFLPVKGGKSTHFIQGGALYLLTPRQQLDVRMAVGLNRSASDFLVGFGYAFRVDGLFSKAANAGTQ